MSTRRPIVAVFGASGLIGEAVAKGLLERGYSVVAIARRFTSAQRATLGSAAIEFAAVSASDATLAEIIDKTNAEVMVNCVGVL